MFPNTNISKKVYLFVLYIFYSPFSSTIYIYIRNMFSCVSYASPAVRHDTMAFDT